MKDSKHILYKTSDTHSRNSIKLWNLGIVLISADSQTAAHEWAVVMVTREDVEGSVRGTRHQMRFDEAFDDRPRIKRTSGVYMHDFKRTVHQTLFLCVKPLLHIFKDLFASLMIP